MSLRSLISRRILHPLTFRTFGGQGRCYGSAAFEGDGGTTVTILNREKGGPLFVNSFGPTGFQLNNGMTVLGSLILFPRTLLGWRIKDAKDISFDSFSIFFNLEPRIDLLVLGYGDSSESLNINHVELARIRAKGIQVEVLPTEHAITTFNFLNAENRSVAGAFIPPKVISSIEQDLIQKNVANKKLRLEDDDD